MKEVKIRQVSNGYIVEYWSAPTTGLLKGCLELNCIEVYPLFTDTSKEIEKYFGVDK